jgi:nickel superoxide dismutase
LDFQKAGPGPAFSIQFAWGVVESLGLCYIPARAHKGNQRQINTLIGKEHRMFRMKATLSLMLAACCLFVPSLAFAHCEIPCGIYHDEVRFELLSEHIETITKSMNQINELSVAGEKNYNQLVRWVTNKEEHAAKFMDIVEQYFLHQRIKPVDPSETEKYQTYLKQVELSHRMLVTAMKCKQTTDIGHTTTLTELLAQFKEAYGSK